MKCEAPQLVRRCRPGASGRRRCARSVQDSTAATVRATYGVTVRATLDTAETYQSWYG